jgi:two-component system, OmpR family, phosphate regulon response regulator PhoB
MADKKKVLIIEDNEDIMFIISLILKDDGFDVIESDTLGIISELDTIKPNLILMDNSLRDGSGSEICRKLKSDPDTSHYPVILISAATDLAKIAKDSLADGFIEKPFELTDFVKKVKQFKMI